MAAVACCRFSHEPSPLFAVVSPDGLVKVHLISIMPFLAHVLVVHAVVEDVHNDTRASLTQASHVLCVALWSWWQRTCATALAST
jgi:hypothetical protein